MPIHHAVLALLKAGTSHGYELKTEFERAIGPQWGQLNIGHLYQVLERLVRDGLIKPRRVPQNARPDRIDYRLTVRGQTELERWLEEPFVHRGGYRNDFFLKLFAAARLGEDRLQTVLHGQREAYLSELAALAALREEYRDAPLIHLLIEAAVLQTEANLRIVEQADGMHARLAEAASPEATAALQDAQGQRG